VGPELGTIGQGAGVVPWVGRLAERLGPTIDDHDRLAAQVLGFPFKDAEQPVVASICTADPDLVEAGYVIVHHLLLAASREGGRRSGRHGVEDGVDLGSGLDGQAVGELDGRDCPGRIVQGGTLEEVDQTWLRVGHACSKLDTLTGRRV
jgi:hypothetical protein